MRKSRRGLYRDLDHIVEKYDVLMHNKKAPEKSRALRIIIVTKIVDKLGLIKTYNPQ